MNWEIQKLGHNHIRHWKHENHINSHVQKDINNGDKVLKSIGIENRFVVRVRVEKSFFLDGVLETGSFATEVGEFYNHYHPKTYDYVTIDNATHFNYKKNVYFGFDDETFCEQFVELMKYHIDTTYYAIE